MATIRHLSRAPIQEAIIDLQVALSPDIKCENLLEIHKYIKDDYPKVKIKQRGEFFFQIPSGKGEKPVTKQESKMIGYMFISSDGTQIVQYRLDGFTFSRLKPYQTWDKMNDEAKRLWKYYVDMALPKVIKRVAVRYINRLEIPLNLKDFAEYLVAPPNIPETLPQGVNSYFSRIVVGEPSQGVTIAITQALEPIVVKESVPIVLDIDVFKEGDFNPLEQEAWNLLGSLRNIKNRFFFESVTEKTVEMYI